MFSLRNGIGCSCVMKSRRTVELRTVPQVYLHARRAAAALLKMAQATSDPALAARLIEAAADLKDQAGDLPQPVSAKPPDILTEQ